MGARRATAPEDGTSARLQWDAERRHALQALAADIAHDLAGATTYFEGLAGALRSGEPLDAEEIEVAHQEGARLRRLLTAMRRACAEDEVSQPTAIEPLLRQALDAAGVGHAAVEVTPNAAIDLDDEALAVLVAALARNARSAAGADGEVGVRFVQCGGEALLEVWDSGPGLPDGVRESLFAPFTFLKANGRGMGIATALGVARRRGWRLAHAREGDRTYFRVTIPSTESPL